MKLKLIVILAFCTLLFGGCMDTTDRFVLNPDGSGKVVHEVEFEPLNLSLNPEADNEDKDAKLKSAVKDEIEKAKGIDVWKDVSYEQRDGNRIYFKGTAYFKNLDELKYHNSGATFNMYNDVSFVREGNVITLRISDDSKDKSKDKPPVVDLTDEEIDAKIAKNKSEYQSKKMLFAGMIGGLNVKRTFQLPGSLKTSSNFIAQGGNKFYFEFNGARLLEVFEEMMTDEEKLREEIRNGRDPFNDGPSNDATLNEQLFGEKAEVEVVMEGADQPLFDYTAEVNAAKEKYSEIAKSLGVTPKVSLPTGTAGVFEVVGVRAIYTEDQANEIRPFNFQEGYALYLIGVLPHNAFALTGGRLTAAKTDNGENLLKKSEWDRRISFPTLGKDEKTVGFELNLKLPSTAANSIQELSGVLEYNVGSKVNDVDLGIAQFVDGAKGNQFGAVVKSVKDSDWNKGRQEMQVDVNVSRHKVKSIKVLDASGAELEHTQGYMGYDTKTSYTFSLNDGKFPPTGSVVMEVYEDITAYELPFTLTNISFMGR